MKTRLGILGAGAIGCVVGGLLTKAGHDVTLIDQWPEHVEAMRRRGLRLTGTCGDHTIAVKALHLHEAQSIAEPFDLLFVAVKSYDTDWATRLGAQYLKDDGLVVDFQNGINDHRVAAIAGAHRTLGCVITIGAGIHHVTFKVPGLRETRARATALGYGVVGYSATVPRWKEAFLHPKDALGIVVQIVESPDEPPRGHWRKPPPMPADPPAPVRLLGLRMTAHAIERARRQWSTLLGGAESVEGGLHVFRWPASPLRIAVEIEPTADEGPTRIDVAPVSRPVAGLGAPAPGLGTVFAEAR